MKLLAYALAASLLLNILQGLGAWSTSVTNEATVAALEVEKRDLTRERDAARADVLTLTTSVASETSAREALVQRLASVSEERDAFAAAAERAASTAAAFERRARAAEAAATVQLRGISDHDSTCAAQLRVRLCGPVSDWLRNAGA